MSPAPTIRWSKSGFREWPRFALTENRVAFEYDGEAEERLVCVNLEGREQWSAVDRSLLLGLPGDRFIVQARRGEAFVLDGFDGAKIQALPSSMRSAERHGDRVFVSIGNEVLVLDLELCERGRFTWPDSNGPSLGSFVAGRFFWLEKDRVHSCGLDGSATSWPVPVEYLARTFDDYVRETGKPVAFWSDSLDERPKSFRWRLSVGHDPERIFVASLLPLHVVLAMDLAGRACGASVLARLCCGGAPQRLPNGRYVVSSGCGGILSWLDAEGRVLRRSQRFEEDAFHSEVHVRPDGSSLVLGGPGLVAFDESGELLWTSELRHLGFTLHERLALAVGSYWCNENPDDRTKRLELIQLA